ncbi:MAG: tyrosine-type recombinase/integrase [Gemmatimonadetes bacterium]|nr:tyrosine-type recombinase/integrase [Gemmatimonadota bacterium]
MNHGMFAVSEPGNGLADHYIDAIAAALDKSRRPATLRAYERAWERFRVWAVSEGLEPLPADPLTVAAYLAYRAGIGRSPSTLALDRKAISYHHGKRGYPSPTASEGVKATLAGLRNQAAEDGRGDPRQARALTGTGLRAIERTAHRQRRGPTGRTESVESARWRGDVDIALASVMRDALLRRGEAARLRWSEVEFWSDGSARVIVRHSKTSSASAVLYVGLRAAKALRRIRPADAEPGDRVFGLRSGRSIANRIAAMARAAELGEGFSGHSPRIGMAQDLTAAGVGLPALMVAGRWKSERMPAYYSRGQSAGRGAVANFYANGAAAESGGR